ncbi:LytR/AlgR family response regulator transcription factor [Polaribacter sp. R77954]|uniref:LytR/AlgR family response regulator transcription factor n=1 Tax=Polaribacter sp. R77954 TaxID=3093870 RepID=UPI0037C773C7
MGKKIKAYIVEDDVLNLELLKFLINKCNPDISIIGEAKNTNEFIDLMLENKADVLFLDVELEDEKSSLDILNDFKNIKPEIIITSASKEYALNAINEFNIFSYLIKPLNIVKINKALTKLENHLEKKVLENESTNNLADGIIAIPDLTSIELLDIYKITYLEAAGKYTVFQLTDGTSRTVSKNIGIYEQLLPKNTFFRIHHKFLININETKTVFRTDGYYCVLKNGKSLPIAKRRLDELRKYLNLK